MSEIPVNMGFTEAPPGAAPASPPSQSSPPQHPPIDRTRGHSPSRDARETALAGGERRITLGGVERPEQEVLDIMADHAEQQIVKAGLPSDPSGYEIRLSENFKAPEGLQFEINAEDPALAEARKAAHEMGLDQAGFSRLLGIYASTRVGELAQTNAARQDQMAALGSAADARIDQVATWLKAKVGDKANIAIATLKQYPVAANVRCSRASSALSPRRAGQTSRSRIASARTNRARSQATRPCRSLSAAWRECSPPLPSREIGVDRRGEGYAMLAARASYSRVGHHVAGGLLEIVPLSGMEAPSNPVLIGPVP